MTKEDILHHFQDINFYYGDCMMYADLSGMLDKLIAENKGDLISRQAVEEINSEIPKIHELLDIAYEYNQEDSTRTELSQKCTTYLLDVWQTLGAIVDNYPPVENKGEWIPVNERLPKIHQYVLLCLRSTDVEVGFRAETEPYFYCHGADGCYIEPQNVLAWQPLPKPYKENDT